MTCKLGSELLPFSRISLSLAALMDPGNISGARTPSRPNAAITLTDSQAPGAEEWARSLRGNRNAARSAARSSQSLSWATSSAC